MQSVQQLGASRIAGEAACSASGRCGDVGAPAVGWLPGPGRSRCSGSGGSWVSQGLFGRNGVFAEELDRRLRAQERERGDARPAAPESASGSDDRVGAAAAEDADVLAVGVAGAALAGDPDEPVGGLLVDRRCAVADRSVDRWDRVVSLQGMTTLLKQEESSAGLLEEGDRAAA